jgi:uncharacterized protein (TIGR02246 family)
MQKKTLFMLAINVLVLGIILTACGFQAQAESRSADDIEAVTAAVDGIYDQYASTLKASDPNGWIALWSDAGVQMPPGFPPVDGTDSIGAGTKDFLDAFTVDSFEIHVDEVQVAGEWAFARGTYSGAYTPKDGSEGFAEDGKYLTIFQKQPDGSWKIHRDIFNSNGE